MLAFPLALVTGVGLGVVLGGRLQRLTSLRFRLPGLVVGGFALHVLAAAAAGWWRAAAFAAGSLLAGAWLVANAGCRCGAPRLGLGLLAVGCLLNGVVMACNKGMPVPPTALERAPSGARSPVMSVNLGRHVPADEATRLGWLGDTIDVVGTPFVASAGDLALFAGLVVLITGAMRRPVWTG